ncbi:MAG TPA: hypothetical protein VK002_11745 [Rubricoccaceae bacterium]|jgi:hypothetical protein|nr:hypothetical protein [Rubricoccaceae bacterium]
MAKLLLLFTLLVAAPVSAAANDPAPDLTPPAPGAEADVWDAFSENLVAALQGDNLGLRCSALQHVVTYGARVDVRAAKFEVVRLFRDHRDERVRMLALAALAQMHDGWVADFLVRSARFEKDEHLARLYLHAAQAAAVRAG